MYIAHAHFFGLSLPGPCLIASTSAPPNPQYVLRVAGGGSVSFKAPHAAWQCGDWRGNGNFQRKKLFLDFFENTTGKVSSRLTLPQSFIKIR
jgi:hypothetical protein